MQIRKNSLIIRLVSGSGISDWSYVRNYVDVNLCPFFWMVVVSALLLPFRPFLNSDKRRMSSIPYFAALTGWVYLHIFKFNLIWSILYEKIWLGIDIEKLTYGPNGVLDELFLYVVLLEMALVSLCLLVLLTMLSVVTQDMVSDMPFMQRRAKQQLAKRMMEEPPLAPTEPKQMPKPVSWIMKKMNPIFEFFKNLFELVHGLMSAKKEKYCPSIEIVD